MTTLSITSTQTLRYDAQAAARSLAVMEAFAGIARRLLRACRPRGMAPAWAMRPVQG